MICKLSAKWAVGLFFLMSSGLFAGCKSQLPSQEVATPAPVTKEVLFKYNIQPGSVYKTKISIDASYPGESYAQMNLEVTSELLSIKENRYYWKNLYSTSIDKRANLSVAEENGIGKNRVVLTTEDEYGNILEKEGGLSFEATYYESRLNKPVTLNESWSGYSIKEGKKTSVEYTLVSIDRVANRDVAVVQIDSHLDGLEQRTVQWVDIQNNITLKTEEEGELINYQKQRYSYKASSHTYDENDQQIIP